MTALELLSPSQRVIWRALQDGEKTVDDLIEALYAGAREPEQAARCIRTHISAIRKKTGRTIRYRRVYRLED